MWDLLDKEYSVKLGVPPEQVRKFMSKKTPLEEVALLKIYQTWRFFLLLHSPTI